MFVGSTGNRLPRHAERDSIAKLAHKLKDSEFIEQLQQLLLRSAHRLADRNTIEPHGLG